MILPPFDRQAAIAATQVVELAWNTRDPAEVIKLFSADAVWKEDERVIIGRKEIWESLDQHWRHALHYRLQLQLTRSAETSLAFNSESEWQHSVSGQWYRAEGNWQLQFDNLGHIRVYEAHFKSTEISAEDRQVVAAVPVTIKRR